MGAWSGDEIIPIIPNPVKVGVQVSLAACRVHSRSSMDGSDSILGLTSGHLLYEQWRENYTITGFQCVKLLRNFTVTLNSCTLLAAVFFSEMASAEPN